MDAFLFFNWLFFSFLIKVNDYNLKLSDNRAKSTRAYLISKGIAADRIESANGYGEYQLKNECSNGVSCSEQKHLINRRSDFIIVAK